MHKCGVRNGKIYWACRDEKGGRVHRSRKMCYQTTNPHAPYTPRDKHEALIDQTHKRKLEPVKRYIITSAQNATPIHRKFFATLLHAKRHLEAELLIVPIRYRNPTSTFPEKELDFWTRRVMKYFWNVRLKINPNLVLLGDIKVQPTATEPLTGFEALTHGESCIIGHTKLQMKVVASPANKFPKIMTTTGACTVPNYTDSRAGALGNFHHTLGAVLVEVQGKKFHLRHLNADKGGEFTDLTTRYTPRGVRKAPRPAALVMGDTHVDYIDPGVEHATFGKGGIIESLDPEALVWHDLCDGYSANPHHSNPFLLAKKREQGLDNIRSEIERAVDFVVQRGRKRSNIIVPSNHIDFVDRWINSIDWKLDLTNAQFYFETGDYILRNSRIGPNGYQSPSPFEYWFKKIGGKMDHVRVLRRDDSVLLGGIEVGMHGDIGPSGSRGSARNLRRIGVKSVIGHSHSPCISEGCYQVGTSTALRLEYTHGPTAWLNTHCVIHADGKRQLITIIDGEWRI